MIPELAVSYVAGLLAASTLGAVVSFRNIWRKKSKSLAQIQANLGRVGKAWSTINAAIIDHDEKHLKSESEKEQITYRVIIFSAIILSWLGFIILLIVFLSPLTRAEKRIFSSRLAHEDLQSKIAINSEIQSLTN